MSRIGKMPIEFSKDTQVKVEDGSITVTGPKGELQKYLHELVNVKVEDNQVIVEVNDPTSKKEKSFWGLYRSLIASMVQGVEEGFEKKLEVNGVGYSVSLSGNKLSLKVGYSHPVEYTLPEGVSASVEGNVITVSGIDKQVVGEVAAEIRKIKKPEPYKGKGIKYVDEVIRRKEGKSGKSD